MEYPHFMYADLKSFNDKLWSFDWACLTEQRKIYIDILLSAFNLRIKLKSLS